jgi:putative tricarboxylic transport membrane protein
VLPGGGGVISSLASYGMEKRRAKDPSRFGKGAIEGVAGPETANNASSTSAFVPLLTLGIPPNVVLALIYGALLINGVQVGPQLIDTNPEIFWGVIASMFIGNLMLLALNIPLVGVFVQLLRVRAGILAAFALLITMVGVFSVNNDVFDMWVVLVFGIVGWLMKKTGFEPGPLVLAFVLGAILETNFRRAMLTSDGQFDTFVTRPLSGTIFGLMALVIVYSTVMGIRRQRSGRPPALYADQLDAAAPHETVPGSEAEGTAGVAAGDGGPADDAPPPGGGSTRAEP